MSLSAFRANMEDITGKPALGVEIDPQRLHSKEMSERASAREQEELLGLPGGSVVSVSGRANSDAQTKTAKQLASRQNAAERAGNDVALWVALMQQGELDAFIAENVVAGTSDEELAKLIEDIEAETGSSFEDYAKDILGDLPERRPGESEMEYQRRIMEEIIEEILDEDGSIKPEYSDDPVARFLRDHELRQEIVASVNDKDQRLNSGEDFDTVRAEAQSEIAASLNAADAYATNAQSEQLVVDGDKGHDGFRDSEFESAAAHANSASFLEGFSPTLSAASQDMKHQFAEASTNKSGDNPSVDQTLESDFRPT